MCSFICYSQRIWFLHSASNCLSNFSYSLCAGGIDDWLSVSSSGSFLVFDEDTFDSDGEPINCSFLSRSLTVEDGDFSKIPCFSDESFYLRWLLLYLMPDLSSLGLLSTSIAPIFGIEAATSSASFYSFLPKSISINFLSISKGLLFSDRLWRGADRSWRFFGGLLSYFREFEVFVKSSGFSISSCSSTFMFIRISMLVLM